jgi:hypothetical protein
MEGMKNDRPAWVNQAFGQFVQDFKAAADPTLNLKNAVRDLEAGIVDPDLLKIRVKLSRDPAKYAGNHPNKRIGMQLGKKAGK